MGGTQRIRVAALATTLGVDLAEVLAASRRCGINVAAAESMLDPRECDLIATELSRNERRPVQKGVGSRASRSPAWRRVAQSFAREESLTGRVTSVVKGGLLIDIGVRAFLPSSQVDIDRVDNLNQYVGANLEVRIIECERSRANVVVSRRVVLEEEQAQQASQTLATLRPGDIRQATVAAVRHNGLAIRVGGLSAFLPQHEIPRDGDDSLDSSFSAGQVIDVTVCDVQDSQVVVSLRTPELNVPPEVPGEILAAMEASTEGLKSVAGELVLDLTNGPDDAETRIRAVITAAVSQDIMTLSVLADAELKRELRKAISQRRLPGVDPTRSRQTQTGFVLILQATDED